DRFPELKNQDNLDWKILALQVELGELANEWRGFKKWSSDQKEKTVGNCKQCFHGTVHQYGGEGQVFSEKCTHCEGTGLVNPLLEEYVDCLHFILSIGLEIKLRKDKIIIDSDYTRDTLTETFSEMFLAVSELRNDIKERSMFTQKETYDALFNLFVGLGEMLGFTWGQIEQAYLDKNKINHERQESGY
ncbi:dUTP diphosphatase, partial [Ralstonia pickettii]|nr:dUTP diphosphatase [Ralstonia pickettii]